MSSDDEMSKLFWMNQATQANNRAAHQTQLSTHLIQSAFHADQQVSRELQNLREQVSVLSEDNKYYSKLLAKPMAEIAQANRSFKETYEAQMELLADWMVSQKAFKELAIQFGIEKGLTSDEVHQMGLNKELDVLENRNDPSHKTNSNTIKGIEHYIDSLKMKFHAKRK